MPLSYDLSEAGSLPHNVGDLLRRVFVLALQLPLEGEALDVRLIELLLFHGPRSGRSRSHIGLLQELDGALSCNRRCDAAFTYHNGA